MHHHIRRVFLAVNRCFSGVDTFPHAQYIPGMVKDIQIMFRTDAETAATLRAAAKADDRTVSALVLRIIKEWLAIKAPPRKSKKQCIVMIRSDEQTTIDDQAIRTAIRWRHQHRAHVERLITSDSGFDQGIYPPSGSDAFRPELWKAAHWRWLNETHRALP